VDPPIIIADGVDSAVFEGNSEEGWSVEVEVEVVDDDDGLEVKVEGWCG
jgi:hypothetical protein